MRHRLIILLPAFLLLLLATFAAGAEAPPFDLAGPKVDVHVQRDGKTLPIAEVPSLLPGDRLWIHPDLPESQSAHYVLVVAFLRGATNPPPPEWFKRVETWNRAVREEGVFVTIPPEAQQALLFLAPETGGDFSTLRAAVRGRPGSFVRATQDLQQASWDRMRLDAYLAEVKAIAQADPKDLKEKTALAARSLGIRLDQQCFDKPTEQQAPCLVQHTEGLVLDDANAQTLVTQLANGTTADLMNQLSYSPIGGAGQFSPYVGAVVDVARILSTLHTAKYQYIPALAMPPKEQQDTLNLRLNVPPSFRDPKSVIVIALPPILLNPASPGGLPQMHSADGVQTYCGLKPGLALSAEGAPLVFATAMAHDLELFVEPKAEAVSRENAPKGVSLKLRADPSQGGFVLEKTLPALPDQEVTAVVRGKWGFDAWEGPKFHLHLPRPGPWVVPVSDQNALITGREDTLHLQGDHTVCVSDVMQQIGDQKPVKLIWKSPKPEMLEVAVPLKDAAPGNVTIAIHQYGLDKPDEISLKAYAEAAALEHLTLSVGDKVALLKGKRLDEVDSADMAGISFSPAALNRVQDFDQLELSATGITSTLQPGSYTAKVILRDGRQLHVPATVAVPRPQIELLSKGEQHQETDTPSPVHLGNPNDLPLQRPLVFFLRSRVPEAFPRTEKVELAAVDGSFQTTLSLSDGSLILEDNHTAVATVDPLARFGASAFGPIQLRVVTAEGIAGDWVPLGTLVRLPSFKELRCPRNPAKPCNLMGNNLYLVTAIGGAPDLSNPVEIPGDFSAAGLTIPNVGRTANSAPGATATLYLRLRDDPETIQTLTLPLTPMAANPQQPSDVGNLMSPVPTSKPEAETPTPEASQPHKH